VATEEEFKKNLDFSSDRISTQVRAVALGVLAIVWAIFISTGDNPLVSLRKSSSLVPIVFLCVLALVFDLLHYAASFLSSFDGLDRAQKSVVKEAKPRVGFELFHYAFFFLKQVACAVAAIWVLEVLWVGLQR